MDDLKPSSIAFSNFGITLEKAERHLFWSVGAALAAGLLQLAPEAESSSLDFSPFGLAVKPSIAELVAVAVAMAGALYAAAEIHRAHLLVRRITGNPSLAKVLDTFPVAAVSAMPGMKYSLPAIGGALMFFVVVADAVSVGDPLWIAIPASVFLIWPFALAGGAIRGLETEIKAAQATASEHDSVPDDDAA